MTSVSVVVPVLGRPHRPAIFVPSLLMSLVVNTDVDVWAITESQGDFDAWYDAGAQVLLTGAHTWPEKCNHAAALLASPWLFFTGDDVMFHCGWLDEALRVAAETGAKVIATNDCHNPFVIRGERGTHLLIDREYIVTRGACLDGPGSVFSEAYHHESDVETAVVSQARGVWAAASDSRVEHHHVTWGLAPDDDTYREGRRWRIRDHQTWMARQATMAERLRELDG